MHIAVGTQTYWETLLPEPPNGSRFRFVPGWQTVYATRVETPLVRVTLADGSVGWGEACCPIGPEVVCLVLDNVIAPLVRCREFGSPAEMWDLLYDAQRGRGYSAGYYLDALAALDVAVWDALGRRHDVPVAALLAGSPRSEIPVYLSGVRRGTVEERASLLAAWVDDGLRGAKLFTTGDIDAGLRELEDLRDAVPDLFAWMVDALWMCTPEGAARAKCELAARGVEFLECPLQPEDVHGYRHLVSLPGVPIAQGEHLRTRHQLDVLLEPTKALDIVQPDVGRTGISELVRIRARAAAAGVPVTLHMGSGGPVLQAATLQCAAAVAESPLLQEFQAGLADLLNDAVDSGWRYADGVLALPDRPGIGVDVSPQQLENLVVRRR
jgi:L-alanine-DL-glutamate epimerase-like enolase superfamily enzyme